MNLPTPDALQVALTLSTLAAVWVGWAKFIGPRVKRWWGRAVGFFQAIAGRDPIVDKITGKELSPAVHPLGHRLASMDDNIGRLTSAIESLNDAHQRIDNHEVRIAELEKARVERLVTQAESAHMWRAVADNAINDGD